MTAHQSKIKKLNAELCPEGVEFRELGEVLALEYGKPLKKSDRSGGNFPVLGSNGRIGFHSSYFIEGPCIIIGRKGSAGAVVWEEKNCYPIDTTFFVKNQNDKILLKYLFYKLQTLNLALDKQDGGVPGLNRNNVYKIKIPIPPLAVQEEIVKILDTFTTLEAELEARKKQYEYYRDELLTFGVGACLPDRQGMVDWRSLGEVAEIGTGSHDTQDAIEDGDYIFYARGREPLRLNVFDFDETAIITAGDGAGVGKVFHYAQGKYALHQRAYRIVPGEVMVSRFVYHYIASYFYAYIQKASVSSSVTSLRRPMFLNFPIPVPPLAEQERIVAILDKFDALVNDISVGLPAELNARRKQYEYYRGKLLTFKEKYES